VSYERAKAEALGFEAKGGIMERAERFVFLGFGLLFNHLLIATLWVMFALTAFTAIQRFVKVWRQAERPPVQPRPGRPRRHERVPRTTRRWSVRQNRPSPRS
jgi:CDP-diacylglycerol--glycerol-3-phosphate 3-phosphatidyltransferase